MTTHTIQMPNPTTAYPGDCGQVADRPRQPCESATPLSIDLLTPVEAGLRLQLSADALLDVVNRGLLPAYDLGGHIRFRAADVAAVVEATAA